MPPQTDLPRRARVSSAEWIDENRFEVAFEGIDDEQQAMGLLGCHCLVARSLIDEAFFAETPASWEGWTARDKALGFEGRVARVVENPGQDLLEIEAEGRRTPVMVPLVDEFVVDVDVSLRRIELALPAGLLEL